MIFYTKEILASINNPAITVVAATKYFNANEMRELYNTGLTNFGENRVEILLEKQRELADLPITWHLIGTLQTKKAKKILNSIDYLHSLDTMKLALEIQKRRTEKLNCFIQVNISSEESKHGLNPNEVINFLKDIKELDKVNIIGLMGMAELTDNEEIISNEFKKLNNLQITIKEKLNIDLLELSIGMSNDYLIAIKHNATYLRLGSVLFKKEV
ncbi:MAG: YggS family pyridoxal phosphate-dependent enzyme [Candidatus Izimaplasma sp.]|nr:YggS family pyridoxal phosphate-dependent enzyme [Candidatus Izimaplasma bacterium]